MEKTSLLKVNLLRHYVRDVILGSHHKDHNRWLVWLVKILKALSVIVKLHEGSFAALADTALDWTRWTRNNTIITNVLFREC